MSMQPPESKNSFAFRTLGINDFDTVLAMQNRIYNWLSENSNPRFIVPREEPYLREHLQLPHSIIGLIENENHIGQAIFHAPHDFDIAELGIDTMPDFENGMRASVLQGMLIDPEYRGHGLMALVIEDWIAWCKTQNIAHLAARTEASHEASQKNFIKHGFKLIDTLIDPRDNAKICVFHRVL